MELNILSSQADSNLLMGFITDPEMKDLYIVLEDLSTIDKNLYNNFFLEFGDHANLIVSNCTIQLETNRVTVNNVSNDTLEVDFNSLDNDQQLIVEQFIDLLNRI